MTKPTSDRNLLFGILALQNNFISSEAFVAAMSVWILDKHKGLAQILREQRVLSENHHALLEESVHEHLTRHANDPIQSLAQVELADDVRLELEKIADPEVQASVARVPQGAITEVVPEEEPTLVAPMETETFTPRKKPAPKRPVSAPTGGVGNWIFLVAGLIVGLAVAGGLVAAFLLAQLATLDKRAPIVQVPPPVNPIKIKDPPPPIKDPLPPEIVKPVKIEPPIVSRKPSEVIGDAEWKIDGDELVVNNPTLKRAYLFFGSKEWADYDFSFETNSAARLSGALVLFRANNKENHYTLSLGAFQRAKHTLSRVENGGLTYDMPHFETPFNFNQWYKVRIESRGNRMRCFVDEQLVFDYKNDVHPRGLVGFGATAEAKTRWKNIKVAAPDGTVLWAGSPDLAGTGLPPVVPPIAAADGFVPLFNGKDLTGWMPHEGVFKGNWSVENGILIGSDAGKFQGHLNTARPQPRDFHLRVEARVSDKGTGMVAFRCPDNSLLGYRSTFSALVPGSVRAGTLSYSIPGKGGSFPSLAMRRVPLGEWFMLEIIANGPRLIVKVNGEVTTDVEDTKNLTPGHIHLTHSSQSKVEFRKIEIKELPPAAVAPPIVAADGFDPLFNGKDLTGWKTDPKLPGDWNVNDGILTGRGAAGSSLYTVRSDYKNVHLRMETRINDSGVGGVFVRAPFGLRTPSVEAKMPFGYRAIINYTHKNEFKTGGFFVVSENKATGGGVAQFTPPGVWTTMEIIAQDNRLRLLVNGKQTGTVNDFKSMYRMGHIAINLSHPDSVIEFRKIEIKEQPAAAPPIVVADGFVPLFNGKDLTGWKLHAQQPGAWQVVDGILSGASPVNGYLFTNRDDYKNFHLRVEARAKPGKTSGLRFRYDHELQGYETTLGNQTGGVIHIRQDRPPIRALGQAIGLPAGQWTTLDIIAQGNRFQFKVNGKTTVDAVDVQNAFTKGAICLYDYKGGSEFRKIEIKELPAGPVPPIVAAIGFMPLFNGKDLTGWKTHAQQPGDWSVKDGVLTGRGPALSSLYSERADYQDFHLRIEARINNGGVGGVLSRATFGPMSPIDNPDSPNGFLAAINSNGNFLSKTGSMMLIGGKMVSGSQLPPPAGEWFTMDIVAEGPLVKVMMKSKLTAALPDFERVFPRGHIALSLRSPQALLEFRKIEIKELPPAAALPAPEVERVLLAGALVPLFNGKDLTGWKTHPQQPGDWTVKDGILVGRGPAVSSLYTERGDYKHFRLTVEARLNEAGLGAVFARAPFGPKTPRINSTAPLGFHALLNLDMESPNRIGSLALKDPIGALTIGHKSKIEPGEWFTLEIHATNNRASVFLNGKMLTTVDDQKWQFPSGHIGLFLENPATVLEIRKIDIRELHAPGAELAIPLVRTEIAGGAEPALTKRFPFSVLASNAGKWRVEGNELVHDLVKSPMSIFFGDPKWTDYDFSIDAMRTAGADQFGLWFRRADANHSFIYGLGARKGAAHLAALVEPAGMKHQQPMLNGQEPLQDNRWYTAKISVRGDKAACYLDGVKLFEFKSEQLPAGGVGLRTWFTAYRFKNIKVTAPDGSILLEGLPNWVPAPNLVAVPAFAAKGDFVPLFNGKDLAGWQPHLKTAGNWRVDNGVLIGAGDEAGILHTVRADYKDYRLRMEARFTLPPDADGSSVLFRSAFGRFGYETVFADGKYTGGLYLSGKDFGKPVAAKLPANIMSGDWFTLEVSAHGNRVSVKVNDKETVDFIDEEKLFHAGHIALSQGAGGKLEFRKIDIQELQPALVEAPPPNKGQPGVFVPLFNGKDLAAWQAHPKRPGNWRVENGVLIANAPGGGSLYSTRGDYQDFHLRVEARINDKGFSRVFVRAVYDPAKIPFKVLGYEALINQRPVGAKTGTLTAASQTNTIVTEAKDSSAKPGEWFTMEIVAKGERVTVKINDADAAEFVDVQRKYAKFGHVVLHQDPNAVIEFRRVEIMDLSAPGIGGVPIAPPMKEDVPLPSK